MIDLYQKRRWEVLIATWLSYAGFYFCRKVFAIVKGPLKARLEVDDLALSHLWTTYLVAYMLGQFLAAALGKRMSSRTLLIRGMAISALANVVMASLTGVGKPAYAAMMVTMAIHGVAQAIGWPHNVAMVANWTTRSERGTVMAIWGTCYQLGSVAAKALAAFLFGWLGLAWSFAGSSVVLGSITVLFIFIGHENPASVGLSAPNESDRPAHRDGPPHPHPSDRTVMGTIVAMGIIYFGFKFIRYALESWSALILDERFGLGTSVAGYLSTSFDLFGFMGVLLAGILSDRAGSRMPIICAMTFGLMISCGLLWWIGLSSATAFVVLLGAIGFMAMGPDALLCGAGAMDIGGAKRAATAAGIINGLGSIGPIVQEPTIGWLMGASGLESVFALLLVVTALATLGTFVLWWNARRLKLPI